ncbi:MAG: invasion associated locus B family protein [Gammaproteobacteria bacterium]|nr:invasion associated locus B family protein [Gammaproteobacteria bacterium]
MDKMPLIAALLASTSLQAEEPNNRTVTETYQDWQVVCIEQDQQARCEARQQLVNQNRQPVALISVGKNDDSTILQFALPHLMDLTQVVKISIDDQKAQSYPYRFCNQAACFVQVDGKDPLLASFKKGTAGSLELTPLGQQPVRFGFSLKGFSVALERLMKE